MAILEIEIIFEMKIDITEVSRWLLYTNANIAQTRTSGKTITFAENNIKLEIFELGIIYSNPEILTRDIGHILEDTGYIYINNLQELITRILKIVKEYQINYEMNISFKECKRLKRLEHGKWIDIDFECSNIISGTDETILQFLRQNLMV